MKKYMISILMISILSSTVKASEDDAEYKEFLRSVIIGASLDAANTLARLSETTVNNPEMSQEQKDHFDKTVYPALLKVEDLIIRNEAHQLPTIIPADCTTIEKALWYLQGNAQRHKNIKVTFTQLFALLEKCNSHN